MPYNKELYVQEEKEMEKLTKEVGQDHWGEKE